MPQRVALLIALFLAACADPDAPDGSTDVGSSDSGRPDGGPADTGSASDAANLEDGGAQSDADTDSGVDASGDAGADASVDGSQDAGPSDLGPGDAGPVFLPRDQCDPPIVIDDAPEANLVGDFRFSVGPPVLATWWDPVPGSSDYPRKGAFWTASGLGPIEPLFAVGSAVTREDVVTNENGDALVTMESGGNGDQSLKRRLYSSATQSWLPETVETGIIDVGFGGDALPGGRAVHVYVRNFTELVGATYDGVSWTESLLETDNSGWVEQAAFVVNRSHEGGVVWMAPGGLLQARAFDGTSFGTPLSSSTVSVIEAASYGMGAAADNSGDLHVVFSDTIGKLKYTTFDFDTATGVGTLGPIETLSTEIGSNLRILVDDQNGLTVLWKANGGRFGATLKTIRRVGGSWGPIEALGPGAFGGQTSDSQVEAALDPEGHVTALVGALTDRVAFRRVAKGSLNWGPEVRVSPVGMVPIGTEPALIHDENGLPLIMWGRGTTQNGTDAVLSICR